MERLFKKYFVYFLLVFIIVFMTISFIVSAYYSSINNVTFDYAAIDLTGVDNLMIVAHPGDETIFGGAHLLQKDYLVVCVTCGEDNDLTYDFIEVVTKTNDKYIILGYPEYSKDGRENWFKYKTDIKDNLNTIINLKEWSSIVTHNPDGEYGSLHHKLVSKMVTNVSPRKRLYYFGKYYTKKSIVNYYEEFSQINENALNQKLKLIGTYKSEDYFQTEFSHIYNYEEWVKYKEWGK